jgi:hypothetical protein
MLASGLADDGAGPKFNKATLFSWLMFLVRSAVSENRSPSASDLQTFLAFFEDMRRSAGFDLQRSTHLVAGCAPASRLFAIYETRSSARVADVSSVILRDAVIWLTYQDISGARFAGLERLRAAFDHIDAGTEDDVLARRLIENGWGQLR